MAATDLETIWENMGTEADTGRKYVVPKLQAADWNFPRTAAVLGGGFEHRLGARSPHWRRDAARTRRRGRPRYTHA
jgi:hypothetical protein